MFVALTLVLFFNSCGKKKVKTTPQKTKVEKVEEKTPKVEKPVLTEEEIFQKKTLDELNKEGHLKMIHFDFDKYNIKDDMKPILQSNSDWLLKHETVEITIEGHCDERGTVEYNLALGEKRAKAAKKYLVSLGVNEARVKTISYGKNKPLIPNAKDEDSHYKNRRAVFVITKK